MSDQPSTHADDVVLVVNTISRRTQPIARSEVEVFLRKHKLFRLVEDETPPEPKKKLKKPPKRVIKQEKEEPSTQSRYVTFPSACDVGRKRKSPDLSAKSSPTPSEPGGGRRKKAAKETVVELPPARPNPLITMSLKEMHEIIRLYTSCPSGCVDWQMISQTATGGRIPSADIEYAANEFLPHVHYRPTVGMVVMERQSKIPTEYQKHRHTMKRLRQGLVPMISELRKRLTSTGPDLNIQPELKTEEEPMLITPEVSPDELLDEKLPVTVESKPNRRAGPAQDISSYLSCLPVHVVEELRQRAATAMNRLEQGHIPTFALRTAPVAQVDADGGSLTATGRIRKRYETKAMRLAREAAMTSTTVVTSLVQNVKTPPVIVEAPPPPPQKPVYEPPPFYAAAARHFERSHDDAEEQ
jgi:hypothetical protein